MNLRSEGGGGGAHRPLPSIHKVVSLIYLPSRYIKSQNIDNYLVWLYKEVFKKINTVKGYVETYQT